MVAFAGCSHGQSAGSDLYCFDQNQNDKHDRRADSAQLVTIATLPTGVMNFPKSILLVEYNPDDADLAVRTFARHFPPACIDQVSDRETALAHPGVEASATDTAPPLPERVLPDQDLPRMDGLDVLKTIRAHARTRYPPVIVVNSSIDDLDATGSLGLGANSDVRIPAGHENFSGAARQIGDRWMILNPTTRAVIHHGAPT